MDVRSVGERLDVCVEKDSWIGIESVMNIFLMG